MPRKEHLCLAALFWTDTIPAVWPNTVFPVVDLT
jgi:hypothetical protein